MMKKMRKAQTMVEYIIIVCLIAIALVGVFTYLSRAVGEKASGAAKVLSDQEGSNAESAIPDEPESEMRSLQDIK